MKYKIVTKNSIGILSGKVEIEAQCVKEAYLMMLHGLTGTGRTIKKIIRVEGKLETVAWKEGDTLVEGKV